jgi:hypothetical protein
MQLNAIFVPAMCQPDFIFTTYLLTLTIDNHYGNHRNRT